MKKTFCLLLTVLLLVGCEASRHNGDTDSGSLPESVAEEASLTEPSDAFFDETSADASDESDAQAFEESSCESSEESSEESFEESPEESPEEVSVHTHSYKNASCTVGGVCSCGANGSPLGHSYKVATCTAPKVCIRCGVTVGSALGHSYSKGYCTRCRDTNGPLSPSEAKLFKNKLTDSENAAALAVAREIAASIPTELTDLDRVSRAAQAVADYSSRCEYSMEGKYYSQAYGVFVKGVYSCAGSTRALGLVLSCMGYSWTHINENQYSHQWIELTMDGELGYADGQVGWAGYGKHPVDY